MKERPHYLICGIPSLPFPSVILFHFHVNYSFIGSSRTKKLFNLYNLANGYCKLIIVALTKAAHSAQGRFPKGAVGGAPTSQAVPYVIRVV